MEKYSFVLEFDKEEELSAYIIDIIKPGRCIRQCDCDSYYSPRDAMRGEDKKFHALLYRAPEAIIDLVYFKNLEAHKVVMETLDCSYAYCVEYGDIVKYYLHVEPPMVKPASRAVE